MAMQVDLTALKTEDDVDALVEEIVAQWGEIKSPREIIRKLYAVYAAIGEPTPGAPNVVQTPRYHCKKGCAWCCYLAIEVLPVEADMIAELVKQFSVAQQLRTRSRIAEIANANLPADEHLKTRTPCPFLDQRDNSCGIYSYRPYACRVHHSMKRDACRVDFYEISNRVFEHQRPEMVMIRAVMLRVACRLLDRAGDRTDFVPFMSALHARLNGKPD